MADDKVNPVPLHERSADGEPITSTTPRHQHAPPRFAPEHMPQRHGRYDIVRPANAREAVVLALRIGVWLILAALIIFALVVAWHEATQSRS